jgi:hypothetical protein
MISTASLCSTTSSKCSRNFASLLKQTNRLAAQQRSLEKHDLSRLHKFSLPTPRRLLVATIRRCGKRIDSISLSLKSHSVSGIRPRSRSRRPCVATGKSTRVQLLAPVTQCSYRAGATFVIYEWLRRLPSTSTIGSFLAPSMRRHVGSSSN